MICIGPGDLERCSEPDDFFRWEIDSARKLEGEGKLKVVIVAHGTGAWEDLICGTSRVNKTRQNRLDAVGSWGKRLLSYLGNHYVIQFEIDQLDPIVEKIVFTLKGENH